MEAKNRLCKLMQARHQALSKFPEPVRAATRQMIDAGMVQGAAGLVIILEELDQINTGITECMSTPAGLEAFTTLLISGIK